MTDDLLAARQAIAGQRLCCFIPVVQSAIKYQARMFIAAVAREGVHCALHAGEHGREQVRPVTIVVNAGDLGDTLSNDIGNLE